MNTTSTTFTASQSKRIPKRERGAWRKLIPYTVGAALLFAIVAGLHTKPTAVETATVSNGPLAVTVLEEGKTRIRHRYTISPPVSGWLNRIPLRAGDKIEAGKTILATVQAQPSSFLDPRARAEAEARVKGAEAGQQRAESERARAQAALELAEKEKARGVELKRSGAIATKEWDTIENQVTMLTRSLHTAEFALRVSEFELAQARAALVQSKSPTPDAEPMKLVSPVTGYVLQIFEESERTLTAGTALMEVGDPTDLEAEIELLSTDAVAVVAGAEVTIDQWGGEQPLRGQVALVEPGGFMKVSALGVEEQRVKVRVNFLDPFPPGRTMGDRYRVEARILTWRQDNVLQVPTGALFRRGGDWMTFVMEGGHARLTKVEIAHNNGAAAEVRNGLKNGQTVILHPPDAIADGAQVRGR